MIQKLEKGVLEMKCDGPGCGSSLAEVGDMRLLMQKAVHERWFVVAEGDAPAHVCPKCAEFFDNAMPLRDHAYATSYTADPDSEPPEAAEQQERARVRRECKAEAAAEEARDKRDLRSRFERAQRAFRVNVQTDE